MQPSLAHMSHVKHRMKGNDVDKAVQMFMLRKLIENRVRQELGLGDDEVFFASLSSRTIVYKGQLTPEQVAKYYTDLQVRLNPPPPPPFSG